MSGSAAERTPSAKAPREPLHGAANGGFKRDRLAGGFRVLLHLFNQVSDDLGVGLGDKLVALRGELVLQLEIIFDDAVVDDDDAAGAVAMRVGVLFRRAAVRSPARVADAEGAVERVVAQHLFKVAQLAGGAADI